MAAPSHPPPRHQTLLSENDMEMKIDDTVFPELKEACDKISLLVRDRSIMDVNHWICELAEVPPEQMVQATMANQQGLWRARPGSRTLAQIVFCKRLGFDAVTIRERGSIGANGFILAIMIKSPIVTDDSRVIPIDFRKPRPAATES